MQSPERQSEIPALVNTLEKVTLLKFSIRGFGSVSVLGSQTYPLRAFSAFRLTVGKSAPLKVANTRG